MRVAGRAQLLLLLLLDHQHYYYLYYHYYNSNKKTSIFVSAVFAVGTTSQYHINIWAAERAVNYDINVDSTKSNSSLGTECPQ